MRLSPVVAAVVAAGLAAPAAAQVDALDASGAVTFYVTKADGGEAHGDAEFARCASGARADTLASSSGGLETAGVSAQALGRCGAVVCADGARIL
jgi:hypothetical protein